MQMNRAKVDPFSLPALLDFSLTEHIVAFWTFPFHYYCVISEKQSWFSRLDPGSVKHQKIMFLTNKRKKTMLDDEKKV